MTTLWLALLITGCLYGARSALRTFGAELPDRRNRLLFAACIAVITYAVQHPLR
jgi:hypothetical protein